MALYTKLSYELHCGIEGRRNGFLSAAEYASRNRIVDRICATEYILNRICLDERKEEVRYENEKFLL